MVEKNKESQKIKSFVFHKVTISIKWLVAERVLTMALSFFVGIYLIRYLGVVNFGKLSYCLSFVSLFAVLGKLGLDEIVIRNLVQDADNYEEILGTAFILKLVGSIITIILTIVLALSLQHDWQILLMIILIVSGQLFSAFEVIDFWFQSQILAGAMALTRSLQLILSSLGKVGLIVLRSSVLAFAGLIVIESLIKMTGMIVMYARYGLSIKSWKFNRVLAKNLIKTSWPLIWSGLMSITYLKIDQIMLGSLSGSEAVGQYAAAVRFSEIWYFIPATICSSVFPVIIQARDKSQKEYHRRLQQLYDLLGGMSFLLAISVTFWAEPVVVGLLGQEYLPASHILIIHIWSGIFAFLGLASFQWLTIENLTLFSSIATTIGAFSNVALNYFLIPSYEGIGAAWATFLSYGISNYFCLFFYAATRHNGWMLTKALLIPFRIRQNWIYLKAFKNLF